MLEFFAYLSAAGDLTILVIAYFLWTIKYNHLPRGIVAAVAFKQRRASAFRAGLNRVASSVQLTPRQQAAANTAALIGLQSLARSRGGMSIAREDTKPTILRGDF